MRKKIPSIRNYSIHPNENVHLIPLNTLERQLDTDLKQGLTSSKAKAILMRDGRNVLHTLRNFPKCTSLRNFLGPFTAVLLLSGLISFIVYLSVYHENKIDYIYYGFILIFIGFINGFSYSYQCRSEAKALEVFEIMRPQKTYVIRDGKRQTTPASDLVEGDIVEVEAGKRLPADIRLIETCNMKVDNCALTNDSTPQIRGIEHTDSNPLISENMAFLGTYCVEGYGRGVVTATGDRCVIGRIAKLVNVLEENTKPPLANEIMRFENFYFILIFVISTMFACYYYSTYSLPDLIISAVAVVVSNIPEALLTAVAIVLTIIAKRLSKKNCIFRNLMALDTLGLTSSLCFGKAAAMDTKEMVVSHIWMNNEMFSVSGKNQEEEYHFTPSWLVFSTVVIFSIPQQKVARFMNEERECADVERVDFAILKFFNKLVRSVTEYHKENKTVFEIPFNWKYKYSINVCKTKDVHGNVKHVMFVKGCPFVLWKRSSTIVLQGVNVEIDDTIRKNFYTVLNKLERSSQNIVGFCDYTIPEDDYIKRKCSHTGFLPEGSLRFVGLIAMRFPIRPAFVEGIRICRTAGIKVILTTSSELTMAKSLATKLGITTGSDDISCVHEIKRMERGSIRPEECKASVLDGNILQSLNDEELNNLLKSHSELVFANITSHLHFVLVDALQRLGETVAVIGKSVNDVIAIKKADIGIVFGTCESDLLVEAADVMIPDDNLTTLLEGVKMGRTVFENIKKVLLFHMGAHLPETIPFFINIGTNLPMPLLSKSFLCLNLGIDIIPGICLGLEKSEGDAMLREPKRRKYDRLLTMRVIMKSYFEMGVYQTAAAYTANFLLMAYEGFYPRILFGIKSRWDSQAINDLEDSFRQEWTYKQRKALENKGQTAFFITVVVMQLFSAVMCKTIRYSIFQHGMRNWNLNNGLIISLLIALIMVHTPGIKDFLHLEILRPEYWVVGIPFSLMLFTFEEIRRYYLRRAVEGSFWDRQFL